MFPCTKCGACCRKVGEQGLFPDRGDGGCIHLGEDDRCMIYDKRPLLCRIDETKAILFPEIDLDEYYRANASLCNVLIEEQGLDKKFLVVIGGQP